MTLSSYDHLNFITAEASAINVYKNNASKYSRSVFEQYFNFLHVLMYTRLNDIIKVAANRKWRVP